MRGISFRKIFILAAMFGLAASVAQAQSEYGDPDVTSYSYPVYYVGFGFGGGSEYPGFSEMGFNEYTPTQYIGATDCASNPCVSSAGGGLGFKLYGGSRFSPHFGAEAFVTSIIGSTSDSDYNNGLIMTNTEATFLAIGGTANGYIQAGDYLHLVGKAGLHVWTANGSTEVFDYDLNIFETRDLNAAGLGAVVGVGMEFWIGTPLRIEYDYYIGSAQDVTFGVGVLSMGIMVPFTL